MRCKQWIFDMDGTLTDSMYKVWYHAPVAFLEYLGYTPKAGLQDKLLKMELHECAEYICREYGIAMAEDEYWKAMHVVVPRLYETVQLKDGVRETLKRLKAEGARLCICSNTWEAQCRTVLSRLGVEDCFEFFITAQEEWSKQKPKVFFEAMRRLGGTDPAACAVCEDSLYAAKTAHGAGFYVIGVADICSRDDEPELRSVSSQFLPQWTELDWSKV